MRRTEHALPAALADREWLFTWFLSGTVKTDANAER
jgi:hypothetical protein